MEFLSFFKCIFREDISVPLDQVAFLVILNSLCLLTQRYKLGLLISYCFVFFWGFVLNIEVFVEVFQRGDWWILPAYVGFGLCILIVTIVRFLQD
jgi:hypothetical protein